jgi:heat shock protein HslJ
MELAIAKSKECGIAGIGVTHSGHAGRLGEYAEYAAENGVIAIVMVSNGRPGGPLAPHGGTQRVLGTNPIAAGAPAGDHPPFVMDFATSAVAAGKLELLTAEGAVLATFAAQSQSLAGTSWNVTGYNNGKQAVVSVLNGTSLTMAFAADGKVGGSAGCNRYSAAYTSEGQKLNIGPAAATRMMCTKPEGVMEQEQQFLRALETVATARFEGDRLELRTAGGQLAMTLTKDSGG